MRRNNDKIKIFHHMIILRRGNVVYITHLSHKKWRKCLCLEKHTISLIVLFLLFIFKIGVGDTLISLDIGEFRCIEIIPLQNCFLSQRIKLTFLSFLFLLYHRHNVQILTIRNAKLFSSTFSSLHKLSLCHWLQYRYHNRVVKIGKTMVSAFI